MEAAAIEEEKQPSGCGLLHLYTKFHRQPPHSPPMPRPPPPPPPSAASTTPSSSSTNFPSPSTSYYIFPPKIGKPQDSSCCTKKSTGAGRGNGGGGGRGNGGGGGPELSRDNSITTDLDIMINDHQRTKGSSTLVRASSGNVMLYGNLGNLRAPGAVTQRQSPIVNNNNGMITELSAQQTSTAMHKTSISAGIIEEEEEEVVPNNDICRALSRRLLSPEALKELGNTEYKEGNFAEAVTLYDEAILMDPQKASYWSNKAAALTGLGKLIEAVTECREAIRLDPSYYRAHHRLATLYLRLGEADRALHHYKLSRGEATSTDITRTQALRAHLSNCYEARRLKDWDSLLKQTQLAISSSGADSAPQVFAFKAEALLMLGKHEEADTTIKSLPKFDIDACTKFFGPMKNAFFLMVRAQVDIAAGRFEDAVSMSNRAARLDTSGREAGAIARKARTVAAARVKGNELFKASKFREAYEAYEEGLALEPQNAILICNRAACCSKLEQWDKAIEDCSLALTLRPSYNKARLRRADCYSKLKEWEASVKDYKALVHDIPEDEEVVKALRDAEAQLRKIQCDEKRA